MCGLIGFFSLAEEESRARGHLAAMTQNLFHRGPDEEGYFIDAAEGVYLGHRRLSILDLEGGGQPMHDREGGVTLVFNGEIYNHVVLRQELLTHGIRFQSDHSDTEVILKGYQVWGEQLLERLDGMWAFCLYDHRKQRCLVARDRLGQKPCYYYHQPGRMPFFGVASELKALLNHPAVPKKPSLLALQKYFAYGYLPSPLTMCEGVWQLPAGHFGVFDKRSATWQVKQYWSYRLQPISEGMPQDGGAAWAEELRYLLDKAVKKRMVADVPVGIFLSGGIDSSAVAAVAAQHRGQDQEALLTFSIGFEEASFDESAYARLVAEQLGTRHYEKRLDLEQALTLVEPLLQAMDEPLSDSSLLPTSLLSQFAGQKVKVALSGDGGDEFFAGYDPFVALKWARCYQSMIPKKLHPALLFMVSRLPVGHRNMSWDFKLKRFLGGLSYPPSSWAPAWMGPLQLEQLSQLFGTSFSLEEIYSEAILAWEADEREGRKLSDVDRLSQFFVRLYLQDDILRKVDRASMLHGLEVRSPFLDRDLIDFAAKLPHQAKLRGGERKWLLKEALKPLLPESILFRRKKGFGMPIGPWLQKERFTPSALMPAWEWFFSSHQASPCQDEATASLLTATATSFWKKCWEEHRTNRVDHRLFLWAAFALKQWQQSFATNA